MDDLADLAKFSVAQNSLPNNNDDLASLAEFSVNGNRPKKSEFSKGFASGIDSLQGLGYGVVGAVGQGLGMKGVQQWGAEGMQRNDAEQEVNPAAVGQWKDVHSLPDFGKYAAFQTGNLAPSMLESMGAAAIGGLAGGAETGGVGAVPGAVLGAIGKPIIKKELEDYVGKAAGRAVAGVATENMANDAAGVTVATKLASEMGRIAAEKKAAQAAATTGAIALNSYGTGVGDIYQSTSDSGKTDGSVASSLFGAVPYAGLDLMADVNLAKLLRIGGMKKTLDGAAKSGALELLKTSATQGIGQMTLEGVQEGGQQIIDDAAMYLHDPATMNMNQAVHDVTENFMAAFVGSAIPSFGAGARHHFATRVENGIPPPFAPPNTQNNPPPSGLTPNDELLYNAQQYASSNKSDLNNAALHHQDYLNQVVSTTHNAPEATEEELNNSQNQRIRDLASIGTGNDYGAQETFAQPTPIYKTPQDKAKAENKQVALDNSPGGVNNPILAHIPLTADGALEVVKDGVTTQVQLTNAIPGTKKEVERDAAGDVVSQYLKVTDLDKATTWAHNKGLPASIFQNGSGRNSGQAANITQNSQKMSSGDYKYTNGQGQTFTIPKARYEAIAKEANPAVTAVDKYAVLGKTKEEAAQARANSPEEVAKRAKQEAKDTTIQAKEVAIKAVQTAQPNTDYTEAQKIVSGVVNAANKVANTVTSSDDAVNAFINKQKKWDDGNRAAAHVAWEAYKNHRYVAPEAQIAKAEPTAPVKKENAPQAQESTPAQEKKAEENPVNKEKPKTQAEAKKMRAALKNAEAAANKEHADVISEREKLQTRVVNTQGTSQHMATQKALAEFNAAHPVKNKKEESPVRDAKVEAAIRDRKLKEDNELLTAIESGRMHGQQLTYTLNGKPVTVRVVDDARLLASMRAIAARLHEAGVRETAGTQLPMTDEQRANVQKAAFIDSVNKAKGIYPYLAEVRAKEAESPSNENSTLAKQANLFAPLLDAVHVVVNEDIGSEKFVRALSLITEVADGQVKGMAVAPTERIAAKQFLSDPKFVGITGVKEALEKARELADKRTAQDAERNKDEVKETTDQKLERIAEEQKQKALEKAKETSKETKEQKSANPVAEFDPWKYVVNQVKKGNMTGDALWGQARYAIKGADTLFSKVATVLFDHMNIADSLKDVKTEVKRGAYTTAEGEKLQDVKASYDANTDTISIWNSGTTINPEDILHELFHAATLQKLAIVRDIQMGGERADKALLVGNKDLFRAYENLSKLADQFLAKYPSLKAAERITAAMNVEGISPEMSEFRKISEFLAESYGDEQTQLAIMREKSPLSAKERGEYNNKKYSMWRSIVDAVKNVLGINKKYRSAFDELMHQMHPILRTKVDELANKEDTPAFISMARNSGLAKLQTNTEGAINAVTSAVNNIRLNNGDKMFRTVLGWHTLNHIAWQYGHMFPALQNYIDTKNRVKAIASALNHESSELNSAWDKWATNSIGKSVAPIKIKFNNEENQTVTQAQLAEATQGAITWYNVDPTLPINKQYGFSSVKDISGLTEDYDHVMSMYNALDKQGQDLLVKKMEMNRQRSDEMYAQQLRNVILMFAPDNYKGFGKVDNLSLEHLENLIINNGIAGHEGASQAKFWKGQHDKLRGTYFHIGRSGDYFIRYKTSSEKDAQEYFMRFENRADRDREVATLAPLYAKNSDGSPNLSWRVGQLSEHIAALDDHSSTFLNSMLQKVDSKITDKNDAARIKAVIRELHIQMLPENAPDRVYVRRRNVAGYRDSEQHVAWARRMVMANYQIARLANTVTLQKHMESMHAQVLAMETDSANMTQKNLDKAKTASDVLQEIRHRSAIELTSEKTPSWITQLNGFAYGMFLGASPSYVLLNALQPAQLSHPVIAARHGYFKSAKELAKTTAIAAKFVKVMSSGKFFHPSIDLIDSNGKLTEAAQKLGISVKQARFLQSMMGAGKLDITQAFEIGRTARGDTGPTSSVMTALGITSHYGEVINRVTSGLAAFNLELKLREADKLRNTASTKIPEIEAQMYGGKVIDSTQFDYSENNLARMMGKAGFLGKVTPLAMGFQRYTAQLIELWVRSVHDAMPNAFEHIENPVERAAAVKEARNTLKYLMINTGILAGTMGLPFATILFAAASSLGSGDDEPFDAQVWYRQWLADMFGKDGGEIAAHGAMRGLGMEMSNRVGMQNLMPFSKFLSDRRKWQDKIDALSVDAWGPAVGGITDFFQAVDAHNAGYDWLKTLEEISPNAVKGIVKANEAYNLGYVLDAKGNKIPYEFSGSDYAYQALGISPAGLAEQRSKQYAYSTNEQLIERRRSALTRQVNDARDSGDIQDVTKAWEDVKQFNEVNPDWKLTRQSIIQAGRRKGKEFNNALNTPAGIPETRRNLKRTEQYANY